jgi:hypothetical protein
MTEQHADQDPDLDSESVDEDAKLPGYSKPASEALEDLRDNAAEVAEQADEDDA